MILYDTENPIHLSRCSDMLILGKPGNLNVSQHIPGGMLCEVGI
jgi:hypothetical protein